MPILMPIATAIVYCEKWHNAIKPTMGKEAMKRNLSLRMIPTWMILAMDDFNFRQSDGQRRHRR